MRRIHVLVEGQTEETFIRDVLGQHLLGRGIYLEPVLAATKRVKTGPTFKGGVISYGKVRRDLLHLLGDSNVVAVTTMIDYYDLPEDFPGRTSLPASGSCYERVEHLEAALAADLRDRRFLPYLSLHEFEALLLVSPSEIGSNFPQADVSELAAVSEAARSPEEINDGKDTHPAARIRRLVPGFAKKLHGPSISRKIGLAALRQRCPHFDQWVTRLERLGE